MHSVGWPDERFLRFIQVASDIMGNELRIVWTHDDIPDRNPLNGKGYFFAVPETSARALSAKLLEVLVEAFPGEFLYAAGLQEHKV